MQQKQFHSSRCTPRRDSVVRASRDTHDLQIVRRTWSETCQLCAVKFRFLFSKSLFTEKLIKQNSTGREVSPLNENRNSLLLFTRKSIFVSPSLLLLPESAEL